MENDHLTFSNNSNHLSQYSMYCNNLINYISYPINPIYSQSNPITETDLNYSNNYDHFKRGFQQFCDDKHITETTYTSGYSCTTKIQEETDGVILENCKSEYFSDCSDNNYVENQLPVNWNRFEISSTNNSNNSATDNKEFVTSSYTEEISHFSDDSGKFKKKLY